MTPSRWDGKDRRVSDPKIDILIEDISKIKTDMAMMKSFINSENGNHIHHLDEHYKTLQKHHEILYGNGKPGIIDILTRMDMNLIHIKEWSASHKVEDDEKHKENLARFANINRTLTFQSKIVYGALGIIAFIQFMAKLGR